MKWCIAVLLSGVPGPVLATSQGLVLAWEGNGWQQKSPGAKERKRRKPAVCLFSVCWQKGRHGV